ncbi:MAG TPA: hypothetical protein VHE60_06915 [Pyrinomonadaceae bacterium]|nr:hypothetical protein [Pyrinomonadaceae bacterium]
MKPEDSQIDVLLKRYGRHAKSGAAAGHLDADELNAFAERSMPVASRSRYVSHLAECDDCRKLATRLSIAAGSTANAGAGSIETASGSLWQKLTSFFAPPMLRYAAFAAVLVVAVGVTFLALRHQRESAFVAENEQRSQPQVGAVKQGEQAAPAANEKPQTFASPSGTISQPAQSPNFDLKKDESKAADKTAAPPKPEKEAIASADNPVPAETRAGKPVIVEQQPSFAPPPPGEGGRVQTQSRAERDAQSIAASGPRKSEPPSDKLKTRDRSVGGISQARQAEGDDNRAVNNQQTTNQQTTNQQAANQQATNQSTTNQNKMLDSNAEAPRTGNQAMNRSGNEESTEIARKRATGGARSDSEKAPETRSAGGHKFRRQGNAWVDTRFKSSMSITNVSRGSDEFRALDSEVRSIAERLGGEVIVVRKGKAYRIH